ncbi:helix-turn-helix domain-containing protein [Brevundimonas sp. R86498]|uniref:helix-turn-helix transcriptional regulator n=1 Tax=Brevundimonas sp. R86498 TaxID=3093845 RepID=UPI0037CC313C
MIYEEYAPSAAIRRDVEAFWRFRLEDHEPERLRHVIPPDGAINLCLDRHADGALTVAIAGPSDTAHVVDVTRGTVSVGARLRPGGGLRAPGAAPPAIAGRGLPEALMEPGLVRWIKTALVGLVEGEATAADAALAAWPFERAAEDRAVAAVADRIMAEHGRVRIDEAAAEAGLSERSLRRRFGVAVGLSPKTFARVRRLRRACVLSLEAGARLAPVSAEAGYADQAHLSREALESFGAPPAAVAAYLRQIRHAFAAG